MRGGAFHTDRERYDGNPSLPSISTPHAMLILTRDRDHDCFRCLRSWPSMRSPFFCELSSRVWCNCTVAHLSIRFALLKLVRNPCALFDPRRVSADLRTAKHCAVGKRGGGGASPYLHSLRTQIHDHAAAAALTARSNEEHMLSPRRRAVAARVRNDLLSRRSPFTHTKLVLCSGLNRNERARRHAGEEGAHAGVVV